MSENQFRSVYRLLSADEHALMMAVKSDAQTLHDKLDHCKPGRETSLAKTKLEEAVMWAVKGITG